MEKNIPISDYDYNLADERIARFPLSERDSSKLLVWNKGNIKDRFFGSVADEIPSGSLVVFNVAKVIRARLLFHKDTGAKIEIFCLEPVTPASYELSLSSRGPVIWRCMVGNARKWKSGPLSLEINVKGKPLILTAVPVGSGGKETLVRFVWDGDSSFGEILEAAGKMPIPPYLGRETEEVDLSRYQTVYSRHEGSVAAPTAGLHFTPAIKDSLENKGFRVQEVTLHVGAGTFLPVKEENAAKHIMHVEHFEITSSLLEDICNCRNITAVGTTTTRTLESIPVLGYRLAATGDPRLDEPVGQWEAYRMPDYTDGREMASLLLQYLKRQNCRFVKASTGIMIVPGFRFRLVDDLITNFHQPKSTLLLLVSAFTGGQWKEIYDHALMNDYRFLSYGDSSLLIR